MKKLGIALLFAIQLSFSFAQEKLDYFLPAGVVYKPEIPTPAEYFRQEPGEWHLTHAQVLSYVTEIARISDRAIIYEYARSHENKPLVHLVFTSPETRKTWKI